MSENSTHVVLSNYPVSRPFRGRLEQRFGTELRFVNISELRQASAARLLCDLRRIRADLLSVATEDEAGKAMLPIMELLAAITPVRRLQSLDSRLEPRSFSRWRAAAHTCLLLIESVLAALDFQRGRFELRRLAGTARIQAAYSTKPRVAYLNCNLWFGLKAGGSVGHISGVANALMDHGLDLSLYIVGDRLLVDERARVISLDPPRALALPLETTYYRFNHRCVATIGRDLDDADVGFIYQRISLGNYAGVQLSRRLRVPLVVEYNGSEAWVAKNWGRALRFHDTAVLAEDVAIQHAHLIVTVSEVLRVELLQRGVEPERIVVYPNCIDPKAFDPRRFSSQANAQLRRELELEPQQVVATFIGTFGQWHGVDVLAQAIRRMIVERRALLDELQLRFVLVGDGQNMPFVRGALEGIDADRYVRLTGLVPQREAPRYLAASDVLLSPHVGNADGSRFFGSPTKLFEYMAMGRGIVASNLDQLGEVLRPAIQLDGASGARGVPGENCVAVLVRPRDVDQLIAGIELLARDAALRNVLGANARRLALSRYTWEHHVAAILVGLKRVGSRAGPMASPVPTY